ncbi:MAG: hypothetical protein E7570_01330 [Ruminococcaceae bacterium]|nr:hypothetical protein [Oscillospiraceae bacterium]
MNQNNFIKTEKMPRRILSVFLALLMVLSSLAPSVVFADDAVSVSTEAQLRTALASGSDVKVKLTQHINLQDRIQIENGNTADVDLDGHRLYRTLEKATANGNIFYVASGAKLTVRDSAGITGRVYGGWTTGNGGAIENHGTLEIRGGTFAANTAQNGGAVFNDGKMTTYGGIFTGNTATWDGGAIKNNNVLNMYDGVISNNKASYGGALHSGINSTNENLKYCYLENVQMLGNNATNNGGAICSHWEAVAIGCTFTDNSAGSDGGAIYYDAAVRHLTVQYSTLEENKAKNGGAICINSSVEANLIEGSTIKNNVASENGGGVQSLHDTEFKSTEITGNIAGKNGGGIYVGNDTITIYDGLVVTGNDVNSTTNNLYLKKGLKLSFAGYHLSGNTNIGVTYGDDTGTISANYSNNMNYTEGSDPLLYFFADVDKKRKSDCLTLLNGEIRYDITGFTDYPPTEEYTYRVTVKTIDDADGWNHAKLRFFTTDGYNGFGASEHAKTVFFEGEIDDEGDQATLTFTSDHFLDKLELYIDFGGGFTWHDWEGELKLYINGVNVHGSRYSTSSSPWDSSDKTWEIAVPEDKKPYPKKIFFKGEDSDDIICTDAAIDKKEKSSKGKVYAYASDQYNVYWKNPDVTINENNYNKIKEHTVGSDEYGYKDIDDDTYYYIAKTLCSEGEGEVDHTSNLTAVYKTKNIVYPEVEANFSASFKFLNTLNVIVRDETVWSATGIDGTKVTLPEIDNPTGYTITGFEKSAKGTLETITENSKEKMVYTFGDGDGVIEANCTANTYTVEYDGNGATKGSMTSKQLTYDASYYQLPTNGFTRTGYNFVGWNTEADGSGTSYNNKQMVRNLASGEGEVVTLYAQWAEKTYKVTFKYPAAMNMEDEVNNVPYGGSITPETFYDFGEEGHYEFVSSNKKLTNIKANVTATLTYEKKEHRFGDPIVVGYRCDIEGKNIYTCQDCGYEETEIVPVGHREVVTYDSYAATCTENGHETVIKCLACGQIIQDGNSIPAIGHNWDYDNVEWKLATSDGFITGSASVKCNNDEEHSISAPITVTEQEGGYLLEATINGRTVSKTLNIGTDIYTVSVQSSGGGTISTTPTAAFPGETIRIFSYPETGKFLYQATLVAGSETLLDDDTFTMPSRNVTVKGLFADAAPNQCGPKAYWKVDADTETLIIYGEGAMFNYGSGSAYGKYAPWHRNTFDDLHCKHIRIEDGITSIGENAFSEFRCWDDIDVYMADSVKTIGEYAFCNFQDLTNIHISQNLESIYDRAFVGCENLRTLYLPETLNYVGDYVFQNADYLSSVYCPANPDNMTWGDNTYGFYGVKQAKIYVKSAYLNTYNSKFGSLVNATFTSSNYFDLTLVQSEGGTLSADHYNVPTNTYVTLTASPDEGCGLKSLSATATLNGNTLNIDSKNRISMPYGGATVTAEFAPYYQIALDNDGTQGAVTVPEKAMAGDTVSVEVAASKGYEFEKITVTDSKSHQITVTNNSFVMPEDEVTVSVSYRKTGYTINYVNTEGGTVSGVDAAREGSDIELEVNVNTGWRLDSLTVTDAEGNPVTLTENNTFMMPDSEVTVNAEFSILTFTVNWIANGEAVETDEGVPYGTTPEYNGETPDSYFDGENEYIFSGWTPEITAVTDDATYTAAYVSSGKVKTNYLDENGEEQSVTATPLTGAETVLNGGWYVVNQDVSYSTELKIAANTNIILADGKTMTANKLGYADANTAWTLSVYAQSTKTGALNLNDTSALMDADIYGGNINLGSVVAGNMGIYGGNVEAISLYVSQGNLILGCADNSSTIKVCTYSGNVVAVADGQILTDGTKLYDGALSDSEISSIANKTLRKATYHTVDWIVNGELEETDENVIITSIPEYNGETPAPYSEGHYDYTFFGWNDGTATYAADELPAVTEDVTYTAVYTETVSPNWHTITINESENGTVSFESSGAYKDDEVTLTVTPDEGYRLSALTVKDADENEITVTDGKFTMPASDVTISATFNVINYNLYVGGVHVNSANCNDVLGDGKVSFNVQTNELTLNGATVEVDKRADNGTPTQAFGIRYNQDEPFTIKLVGENRIVDASTDEEGVTEKYGIFVASTQSFTVNGNGSLSIEMNADDENTYYGIQSRQNTNIDGAGVSINIPGTAPTYGYYLMYSNQLTLENGASLKAVTGSNENTYSFYNDRNNDNLIAEEGTMLEAVSGNAAFNSQFILTSATKTLGVKVSATGNKADSTKWNGSTSLGEYKYIMLPFSEPENAYNLSLESGIKVNFFIDMPYYNAEGGHIEYTYLETTDDKNASRKTYSVNDSALDIQDDGTRKLILKAAPAQLAEEYSIYIYNAAGEKMNYEPITASIEDYCNAILGAEAYSDYHELVQSLLNYGALADEYFDYAALSKNETGNDYSISHSLDYKADVDAESFRSKAKASCSVGKDASGKDLNITGVTYLALLEPEFRFYVSQTNEVWCYYTELSISDPTLTAKWIKTENGNCVSVTGLKADDFGKIFTLTIGTTEITYNGYAYLYTVLRSESTADENLKNLAKGVFRYAAACEAKFI